MNTLKNDIILRLEQIKREASDIEITETSDAVMLSTYIHFDYIEVTVKKNNAVAGWVKKNGSKNDYRINFEIVLLSDTRVDVNVYTYGLFAQTTFMFQNEVWRFHRPDRQAEYREEAAYPCINFLNSLNQSNQFTSFVADWLETIRGCLNGDTEAFDIDCTTYDNEPPCGKAPEGDLVITINEKNINTLAKSRNLKVGEKVVKINRSMIGKKIVLKDDHYGAFFPLNDDDFADCC